MEEYNVTGYYETVRLLTKLNYPKLKKFPPFTGRKSKVPINNIFYYIEFLCSAPCFISTQLTLVVTASLNVCAESIDPEQVDMGRHERFVPLGR